MKLIYRSFFLAFIFGALIPSIHARPTRIFVYAGEGTDESLIQGTIDGLEAVLLERAYTIERIDAQTLQREALDPANIALIFMPGGTGSSTYVMALGESGLRNIVSYVEQGGCYAGACAGSALMTQCIVYALPDGTQLRPEPRTEGTFLFQGTAYGPAINAFDAAATGRSASAPEFSWTAPETDNEGENQAAETLPATFALYWNGGCLFAPSPHAHRLCTTSLAYAGPIYPPVVDVLAAEVPHLEGYPAIVLGEYGNGRYLLMGPHPELGTSSLVNRILSGQIGLDHIRSGLWNFPQALSIFMRTSTNYSALVLALCLHRMGLRVRTWEQFTSTDLPY